MSPAWLLSSPAGQAGAAQYTGSKEQSRVVCDHTAGQVLRGVTDTSWGANALCTHSNALGLFRKCSLTGRGKLAASLVLEALATHSSQSAPVFATWNN